MLLYENVTIFDPTKADEDITAMIEATSAIITGNGGEILKVDQWGRRKMAYEMNKHDKGNYVLYLFRAPSDTLLKIETAYKVNESIIKYMNVKLGKKHAEGAIKALADAEQKAASEAAAAKAAAEAPAAEPAAETTAEAAPAKDQAKADSSEG